MIFLEVTRPALFSSTQSVTEFIMLQSATVSQIHPYVCGRVKGRVIFCKNFQLKICFLILILNLGQWINSFPG